MDFYEKLKSHFRGEILLDQASRVLYSTDASSYQIEPLGVAIPKTQDDLHAVVELAAKYQVPILPRGSGSSLAGQAIGTALILDCSRYLDSIIEIDPESRSAFVEPGVVLANLNRAAAKYGLMFGPDPASAERATMGGVIGNNATGAHSILYGMSADHLLEADVILSDGSLAKFDNSISDIRYSNTRLSNIVSAVHEIRQKYSDAIKQNYPKSWRNSAGYRLNYLLPWSPSTPPQWTGENYPANLNPGTWSLAPLLAGSEGTLAVIRKLKVALVSKPKHTMLGVLSYASIAEACDDVPRLLKLSPSAVELIPQLILRNARSIPAYARQMGWVVGDPAAVLVVEFSGDQPSALKEAIRHLGDVLTIAETAEEQARIWNLRKVGLGILDSRPQPARPVAFIEDCAIPVEKLGDFVREVEKILDAHGTFGGIYAHASAGCLHIRPVLDLQRGEAIRAMRGIVEQVFALTMSLGGAMSSEHGDGIARGEFIERTYGSEVTQAMRLLKQAADPDNLLNPKKLFDAPPMDTNLRYGESYHAKAWQPLLRFEHEHGLVGAIEACNGQGVCRKSTGVMCPSFQATRNEANSTRGRANLLRALIISPGTIQGGRSEIENSTFTALDLCLACKGCTSECPSGVDMPKLKYEFENQYYKTHRRPMRDYLFGYFDVVAKVMSPVAPLANALMDFPPSKTLISKTLGLAQNRPLPKFANSRIKSGKGFAHVEAGKQKVIFISDVFSRFIEPQVEQAALNLLNACGYDVYVLPVVGCGAALLSKGFLSEAKLYARRVLALLDQADPKKEALIVGVEPPEIYLLKSGYGDLVAEAEDQTRPVWLVDELLIRSQGFDDLRVAKNIQMSSLQLFFHPHCHQRAEGMAEDGLPNGTGATIALLRACGCDVELSDASCCGMAGTFGFEAEHYQLSMQVGELSLLPKIRALTLSDAESIEVVSSGAACRMQIKQGAGIEAEHPLVIVAGLLGLEAK